MSEKQVIHTTKAPQAIGTYSQAIKVGSMVFLSGQIPLDPTTMTLISENIEDQVHQVFRNLDAVIQAAGGTFANVVKFNVYLTDLANFALVNEVMAQYVQAPYPARAAVGVKELPKGALVEIEGVLVV